MQESQKGKASGWSSGWVTLSPSVCMMTLHVQVIPPHDHDALLDQIQHYLMDHYQIEHATIQMEYQPCHGPDCQLIEVVYGHSNHNH